MQQSYSSVRTAATAAPTVGHPLPPRVEATALAHCLEELAKLPGADAQTCRWLRDKLADATFNLVVAGQFKRGKSTLINALLGDAVLPVGVVPLTSVVTVIRFGETPSASVEFQDNRKQELPLGALEQYVTERGNPKNAKGVSRVVVRYPCAWLGSDVQLIDTPGIDSVHEHNTDVTRSFMPQADAVIFVASVEQPLSRAELDFLQSVRPYAAKLFCVLNKVDQLSPSELQESLAFCAQSIQQALGAAARIFPVSARDALQWQQRRDTRTQTCQGFLELRHTLQSFMFTDRSMVWKLSVATTLRRMLSQIRFTLELARSALTKPLDQLQDALATLRRRKQEAVHEQVEHAVLMQAHASALLHDRLEPELMRFKQEQQGRVAELLDDWYAQLRALPLRQLQASLEQRLLAEIRSVYDGWLAREEPGLARAFDELCARFWTQMRQAIDEIMSRCGELFGLSFESIATDSVWHRESRFDYKFWSEPTSLRVLSSAVILALPRALATPLLRRRMRERALDLVEMHGGRLRSDLEQRVQRSVEDFRNRLIADMTGTISRIEEAVSHGIDRYTAGQADLSARAASLAELLEQVRQVEMRIQSITP